VRSKGRERYHGVLVRLSCTGLEEDGLSWQSNRDRRPAVGKIVRDCAPVPLGDEGVVEKRPGGVRRLGVGSIGVRGDRKGRSHGEAEAVAAALRR
jgi:hypothetical protein